MQNEKLFEKIKNTALTETSGTDEYNPEKLWADINKRKNKKSVWLWGTYAAASVVLIMLLLLNLPEKQQEIYVVNDESRPEIPKQNPLEHVEKKTGKLAIFPKSPASNIISINRKNITEQRLSETAQEPVDIDISITDLQIHKSEIAENQKVIFMDSTITPLNDRMNLQQNSEKVLVANIALPENKIDQQSGLQRIFDQVKKDREARKIRLQFNRNTGKLTLWSFVHQSFMESSPVIQKPRQPDVNH